MVKKNNTGDIIRQARLAKGLNLQKLAAESGVSSSHLGRIERGERSPSIDILRKISEPLGFKGAELLLLVAGYSEGGRLSPHLIKGFAQALLELHQVLAEIAPTLENIAKE